MRNAEVRMEGRESTINFFCEKVIYLQESGVQPTNQPPLIST